MNHPGPSEHRTVLRGGTVVDGLADLTRRADVEVVDDRIAAVGVIDPRPDDVVVDCRDRLILPGFVDAHSHADSVVLREDVQLALLRQGVTTVIGGQDGVSFTPGDGAWAGDYFAAINGHHPTYRGGGIGALLHGYDGAVAVNVGMLVGAGTIRHETMAMSPEPPSAQQRHHMVRLVERELADGALGLSSGLDYVPGLYADTAELTALCAPVAAAGAVYVTHMRGGYEANSEAGLREVAAIAEATGVRVHVSHFHVDADESKRLLTDLAVRGIDVTFDMYPYTRGCTLVSMALLPPEFSAAPVDDAIARLSDPDERARLHHSWFPTIADKPSLGPDWPDMVRIGHTVAPDWAWAHGLTLAEIARQRGTSAEVATMDLLVAGRFEVNAVMAVRDERPVENLARLFAHDGHVGGSDGIFVGAVPHPRAFGTFARYLGTYVGRSFDWTSAAAHLASRPAARFGLVDRGAVRPGWIADLIVVDPTRVADTADYQQPRSLSVGIDDVLVNGRVVLAGGRLTSERAGRGLRRAGLSR